MLLLHFLREFELNEISNKIFIFHKIKIFPTCAETITLILVMCIPEGSISSRDYLAKLSNRSKTITSSFNLRFPINNSNARRRKILPVNKGLLVLKNIYDTKSDVFVA